MKKKFSLCIVLLSCFLLSSSQGLILTMEEQLTRLQTALLLTKQGYSIAQKGFSTISDIKRGRFNLQSVFFSSFWTVNSAVQNNPKTSDILTLATLLYKACTSGTRQAEKASTFSSQDLSYFYVVYEHMRRLTNSDLDELARLLTDDTWQMTDDDRLHRIEVLHAAISGKLAFVRSFNSRIAMAAEAAFGERRVLRDLDNIR